jgi:hypothetical protein
MVKTTRNPLDCGDISARIRAPWSEIMLRQMASPRPLPLSSLTFAPAKRKKHSKIRYSSSAATPGP